MEGGGGGGKGGGRGEETLKGALSYQNTLQGAWLINFRFVIFIVCIV